MSQAFSKGIAGESPGDGDILLLIAQYYPIYHQRCAGHDAAFVAGEEQGRQDDLARLANSVGSTVSKSLPAQLPGQADVC
jgi:hypothetical protein